MVGYLYPRLNTDHNNSPPAKSPKALLLLLSYHRHAANEVNIW